MARIHEPRSGQPSKIQYHDVAPNKLANSETPSKMATGKATSQVSRRPRRRNWGRRCWRCPNFLDQRRRRRSGQPVPHAVIWAWRGSKRRCSSPAEFVAAADTAGWFALQEANISPNDFVIGITASGTTPFVLGALKECRKNNISTGCIVSNPGSPVAAVAEYPVEVITGPEFLTGSTRMKCGTAQKMIFDIISTTTMIQLGRVEDNRMVHVLLINDKLTDRAVKMLMEKGGINSYDEAKKILLQYGSVNTALNHLRSAK